MLVKADEQKSKPLQEILANLTHSLDHSRGFSVDTTLAAVITVEEDTRYIGSTLTSVMNQSVLPGYLLIVDCAHTDSSIYNRSILDKFPMHVSVVTAKVHSYGDAVTSALNEALNAGIISSQVEYIWLLHDDSRPVDTNYVDALNEVRHNNTSATVIGAKQVSWDEESLINVGYFAGPHHTVTSLVVDGEIDQDQYDSRQDVFSVSLAGAFIRLSDWMRLGGFSSSMNTYGQSRDFNRRVVRSGGRVIVEPRVRIAHRRARFDGVRTVQGAVHHYDSQDISTKRNSALHIFASRDAYFYSDVNPLRWLYLWPLSLIVALWRSIIGFAKKRPYEALCELIMPWNNLIHCISIAQLRTSLNRVRKISLTQIGSLTAHSEQIQAYKDHTSDIFAQNTHEVMSGPMKKHLRALTRTRYVWLAVVTLLVFIVNIALNFAAIRGVFSGQHIISDTLLATSSTSKQLFTAASTPYTFAQISGQALPASPFLLVYACISLLTFGHAWLTSFIIVLVCAPLSVMSMWALAGIYTRSNISRIVVALTWVFSGFVTGVFLNGNLAMMLTYVFLPAGVAFMAKALGAYQTERPIDPEPSIQQAAWSALCFAVVSACEPQLFLLLILCGIFIAVMYHKHFVKIISLIIPSLILLLPTLVSVIRNPRLYGQLFADITNAQSSTNSMTALYLVHTTMDAQALIQGIGVVSCIVLILLSVLSLFLPSILKPSRGMWIGIALGTCAAAVIPHIAVDLGEKGAIYASVVPVSAFVVMNILATLAMVSGPAIKKFIPILASDKSLVSKDEDTLLQKDGADSHSRYRVAFGVTRTITVIFCMVLCAVWSFGIAEYFTSSDSLMTTSSKALPIVAQEYLSTGSSKRVLAVDIHGAQNIQYSVLSSPYGDIINSSAASDVQQLIEGSSNKQVNKVEHAIAQLAEGSDDEAISQLSDAGFGGVYVTYSGDDTSFSSFVSHAAASNNTETVVNNDQGAYIRISIKASADQGVSMKGYDSVFSSGMRMAWLVLMIIAAVAYVALGLPRIFTREEE